MLQSRHVLHRVHIRIEHSLLDLSTGRVDATVWKRRYKIILTGKSVHTFLHVSVSSRCRPVRWLTLRLDNDASPIRGPLHERSAHRVPPWSRLPPNRRPFHAHLVPAGLGLALRRSPVGLRALPRRPQSLFQEVSHDTGDGGVRRSDSVHGGGLLRRAIQDGGLVVGTRHVETADAAALLVFLDRVGHVAVACFDWADRPVCHHWKGDAPRGL